MDTSIQISKTLLEKLRIMKIHSKESYEDIIWDLIEDRLEFSEETKKNITQAEKDFKEGRTIQVRTALVIERDGVEISRTFINRQVFVPGTDVSNEDECVQRIAAVEHTPQCIANFETKQAEREVELAARENKGN